MNRWKAWTILGATAVALAGCGAPGPASAPNATGGSGNANSSQPPNSVAMGNSSGTSTNPNPTPASNGTGTGSGTSQPNMTPLPQTKQLTLHVEGMTEQKTAKLFKSSNGYYMYVLSDHKVAGEEPGSDSVTFDLNSEFQMRITMLPKDASAQAKDWAKSFCKASLNGAEPNAVDLSQSNDPFLKAHALAVFTGNTGKYYEETLALTFDGVPFEVWIQQSKESESLSAEYAMLDTIHVLNAK